MKSRLILLCLCTWTMLSCIPGWTRECLAEDRIRQEDSNLADSRSPNSLSMNDGGIRVPGIALWDGKNWSSLESWSLPSHRVRGLFSTNNQLFFYGDLGFGNGNELAMWDGHSWEHYGDVYHCPRPQWMSESQWESNQWMTVFDGRPFVIACDSRVLLQRDSSTWARLLSFPYEGKIGKDEYVNAVTCFGDRLIVGGDFSGKKMCENARNIASWDGTKWMPFGEGLRKNKEDRVTCLGEYQGRLIAGGAFRVGKKGRCGVVFWDGQTWIPLLPIKQGVGPFWIINPPSSLDFRNVQQVISFQDHLIACGDFPEHIASWNGHTWESLGGGTSGNGLIFALAVYDNKLFVGGDFDEIGGHEYKRLACWDGNEWQRVDADGSVFALAHYADKLVVAGEFERIAAPLTKDIFVALDKSEMRDACPDGSWDSLWRWIRNYRLAQADSILWGQCEGIITVMSSPTAYVNTIAQFPAETSVPEESVGHWVITTVGGLEVYRRWKETSHSAGYNFVTEESVNISLPINFLGFSSFEEYSNFYGHGSSSSDVDTLFVKDLPCPELRPVLHNAQTQIIFQSSSETDSMLLTKIVFGNNAFTMKGPQYLMRDTLRFADGWSRKDIAWRLQDISPSDLVKFFGEKIIVPNGSIVGKLDFSPDLKVLKWYKDQLGFDNVESVVLWLKVRYVPK